MGLASNLAKLVSKISSGGLLSLSGLENTGADGQVLTRSGGAWSPQALPAGGVTSLNGQTGAITNTNSDVIGSVCSGFSTSACSIGSTVAGSTLRGFNGGLGTTTNPAFNGTWRNTGCLATIANSSSTYTTFMRVS